MADFKYLSAHEDFESLKTNFKYETLKAFEEIVAEYEASGRSEKKFNELFNYGYAELLNWYDNQMNIEEWLEMEVSYE